MCNYLDIYLADLPIIPESSVQHGKRPVIIVSNDYANKFSPTVNVVPLTARMCKKHLPTHVFVSEQGLRRSSIALCEQLLALDQRSLMERIGSVNDWFTKLALRHALAIQLNLPA